jgi:peptidoglycan/xylan/chitin deacetylase (PgdA/CDA1 family)
VAIVIDGLPDRPLAARMVDVLQKHHAEATFFVEGQNAADDVETIRLLRDAGFELGNYTFVGLAGFDKVSQDEQLQELCRTQKIISVRSAFIPTLFRAPRTVFTDALLQTVHASGLPYAVKENVRVSCHLLIDDAAADAYVAGIPDGSIIAIPANRPVERKADTEGKIDERPAIDMKPTIQDSGEQAPMETEDLASELDRLLTALEKRGFKVMNVNGFRKIRYIPANAAVAAEQTASAVSKDAAEKTQGGEADGQ